MKKTRQFTLIEIILASVMLLIAILGSSSFFFANRRNLRSAELQRSATWKAVSEMERLKSLPFEQLNEGETTENVSFDNNFTAEKTVTVEPGENELYKKVTVTVQWNDSNVRFVSYIADY